MNGIQSYRGYTICRSLRPECAVSIYSGLQRIAGAESPESAQSIIDEWLNAR
jgi:hypothetical protein